MKGPISVKCDQKASRVAGRAHAARRVAATGSREATGAGTPAGRSRTPRRQATTRRAVSAPLPAKVAVQPAPSRASPSGTVVPICPMAPARPVSAASNG